jgi:hypothetical protein
MILENIEPKIVFPKGKDYVLINTSKLFLDKIIRSDYIITSKKEIDSLIKFLENGKIISGLRNYNLIEPKGMTAKIAANGRPFNGEILKCGLSKIFSGTITYGLIANHTLNPKCDFVSLYSINVREDYIEDQKFYYVSGLAQLLK